MELSENIVTAKHQLPSHTSDGNYLSHLSHGALMVAKDGHFSVGTVELGNLDRDANQGDKKVGLKQRKSRFFSCHDTCKPRQT